MFSIKWRENAILSLIFGVIFAFASTIVIAVEEKIADLHTIAVYLAALTVVNFGFLFLMGTIFDVLASVVVYIARRFNK